MGPIVGVPVHGAWSRCTSAWGLKSFFIIDVMGSCIIAYDAVSLVSAVASGPGCTQPQGQPNITRMWGRQLLAILGGFFIIIDMVQLTVEYLFCACWSYTQPLTDNCFPTRYIFNHLELIFRFTWKPTFWISVQIWFFGTWYALLVFICGFLDGCYLIFHLFSVFVLIFQNCGKNTEKLPSTQKSSWDSETDSEVYRVYSFALTILSTGFANRK